MKISRLEIKSESFDIIHHATTSKGNQAKYTDGEIWIKTNYLGYEDLAEYLSNILAFDAVVMNEDRHIYNLAIIYCEKTDTYRTLDLSQGFRHILRKNLSSSPHH